MIVFYLLGFFLFSSLVKLSLFQSVSFLAFALPILSPILLMVREVRKRLCHCLAAHWGQFTTLSKSVSSFFKWFITLN